MFDDSELIKKCQHGDSAAREAFFDRFGKKILRWAKKFEPQLRKRGHEPHDAAQDVMLAVFNGRSPPSGEVPVEGWLFAITKNAAFRKQRSIDRVLGFFDDLPEFESAESAAVDPLLSGLLERGLANLSLSQREVLILYDLEERSAPEVARMLGVAEGTVRSRVAAGRRALLRDLKRQGFELEDALAA